MREEIIKMARMSGFSINDGIVTGGAVDLADFFHMAQAAEREACEKICVDHGHMGLAAAIRARGQA